MVQRRLGSIDKNNYVSSSEYMKRKLAAQPIISPKVANGVSQIRKTMLEEEMEANPPVKEGATVFPSPIYSTNLVKTADSVGSNSSITGGGGGWRGSNSTLRQSPDIYSPLWLNSNLNLPRDRATVNSWSRAFFALNGLVQNAINLHSTYPISKLNIKCKNKKAADFFEQMIEEIDLMNICIQIAQEYWILGEAFVYAELDENNRKWNRLVIQNPDYMVLQRSLVSDEPVISMRPDDNLRNICKSNNPSAAQQRMRMPQHIVEHVKRGENIPLPSLNISHIVRKVNPYDTRGTGLIVSSFRNLMLLDKIREAKFAQASNMINPLTLVKIGGDDFKPTPDHLDAWRNVFQECYDDQTEVLTPDGFKKFNEIIDFNRNFTSFPRKDIKVACYNPLNNQMEYHLPSSSVAKNYEGEMCHFHNKKYDIKVTPGHEMYLSKRKYHETAKARTQWLPYKKITAEDVSSNLNEIFKFKNNLIWEGKETSCVNVCGHSMPIETYLQFLGYVISKESKTYTKLNKKKPKWNKTLNGICFEPEIYQYFIDQIENKFEQTNCKKIPRWVLELSPRLLSILLEALLASDDHRKIGKKTTSYSYHTTSKQLADDVFELVYKCGFVPILEKKNDKKNKTNRYRIHWSSSEKGNNTLINKSSKDPTKSTFDKVYYQGMVYCLTVPTGLIVTRRNGKVTIQGNCQNDPDFKIFTHDKVTVERIGHNGGILDVSGDIQQLIKEILVSLFIPPVLMDGGDSTTYANGSVALDALRQRYMSFRNMMTMWLRRRIFAPIAKINDFYDYVDRKKVLIVPDVEWNHMSLFDVETYVNALKDMSAGEEKSVSKQTVFRSLGLSYEDEITKMRKEMIDQSILKKEQEQLQNMTLNELRALKDGSENEIQERPDSPLPGEQSSSNQGGGDGAGMEMGGSDLPGVPPPPPPESPPGPPK